MDISLKFMRGLPRLLTVCLLGMFVALIAVSSVQSEGSAQAANKVVGPGESIQKAINAADPGDTIVVRGVHREDVIIRKNGIKLRGVGNAVIEAPPRAKADSPCSRTFGPEGICVLGDQDLQTGQVRRYVEDVSISGFTVRGFEAVGIDVGAARDATVTKIRAVGNKNGIGTAFSVGTKLLSNVVRDSGEDAIGLERSRDVTISGNDVEGSSNSGIFIGKGTNATISSNDLTDNNLGMLVVKSTGTKILSNDISRSGDTGITIFGPERANNDAKVVGNNISGNIPSGPTAFSGGVVVSTDPFFGGSAKLRNNSVIGNHFGRNKPDIFWDESGSGNRFVGNLCNTSVPSRLCN